MIIADDDMPGAAFPSCMLPELLHTRSTCHVITITGGNQSAAGIVHRLALSSRRSFNLKAGQYHQAGHTQHEGSKSTFIDHPLICNLFSAISTCTLRYSKHQG
jgi:hypothetical protein